MSKTLRNVQFPCKKKSPFSYHFLSKHLLGVRAMVKCPPWGMDTWWYPKIQWFSSAAFSRWWGYQIECNAQQKCGSAHIYQTQQYDLVSSLTTINVCQSNFKRIRKRMQNYSIPISFHLHVFSPIFAATCPIVCSARNRSMMSSTMR